METSLMDTLTFTIHKSVDELYYFRLRKQSNEWLFTSRNYSNLRKCVSDIYAMRINLDCIIEEELHPQTPVHRFIVRSHDRKKPGVCIAPTAIA